MVKSFLGRLRAPAAPSPYRAALIVGAAALALATAGCAGGDPTATSTSPPTATAPPVPSPTPTPAADTAPPPTPTLTPTGAATLTPDDTERLFLEIIEPEDESVVSTEAVAVQGTTAADAVVSVNGAVVEVDAQGAFEAIVTLEEGPNLIEVVASDLTGAEESRDIVVIYIP